MEREGEGEEEVGVEGGEERSKTELQSELAEMLEGRGTSRFYVE